MPSPPTVTTISERWSICPQFRLPELDRALPWLTEQGLGVQARAEFGDAWQEEVDALAAALEGFEGPRHLHGPTFDRQVAWPLMSDLYERGFRAAVRLGCRSILFHPYLVPLRERGAELERWFGYWRAMAARAESEGIQLALENVYDRVPDEIRSIVDDVASLSLGTCVDLAHATLFAQDHDPLAWVRAMGERIKQVHLSDNDRSRDQHRTLGEGELDIGGFLGELAQVGVPLTVALEVGTLEGAQKSVEHLAQLGVRMPKVRSERPTG